MPPIDQRRVREKMDEYMSRRDYAGAEKHLLYWLEEARLADDQRGELMVRNELIGHFRKTGNREGAIIQSEEALRLIGEMGFDGTITSGTTYVNIATACNAFGEDQRSLEMFQKAQEVYERIASTDPQLLGGLYNNMALTLVSLGRLDEAMTYYDRALEKMAEVPGGQLEQAITLLNMADAWDLQLGPEEAERKVQSLVDQAYELLEHKPDSVEDGYYAFVLEKCAPSFEYYGYFLAAEELKERAKKKRAQLRHRVTPTATTSGLLSKIAISEGATKKSSAPMASTSVTDVIRPNFRPARMRSFFPAPRFCDRKVDSAMENDCVGRKEKPSSLV